MTAYYNEIDAYAAQWLRNLIVGGHIAPGDVDERSIVDVHADDLAGYTQCHFFAGIGGWSLAARIAGWPDDEPLWTGSPPCQDHSLAGSVWGVRRGIEGPRGSLVRPWLDLIDARRPCRVAFENVPGVSPALAEIEGRLAGAGYCVARSERASSDLAAPHRRRRVWIAADRNGSGLEKPRSAGSCAAFVDPRRADPGNVWSTASGRPGGMADGFPARVAAIRAFGNAIDPWVGSDVIRSFMEARP